MRDKNTAILYESFYTAVSRFGDETRLAAYDAYMDYAFNGNEYSGVDPVVAAVMELIYPSIDKAKKRWEANTQNGAKGGRPKTEEKPNENPTETQTKPNENLTKAKAIAIADDKEKTPTESKRKHGPYGHVRLTDTEYQKLYEKFGEPLRTNAINKLDEAIEEKGYKYKSHYLVIAKEDSWVLQRLRGHPPRDNPKLGLVTGTDYDSLVKGMI